MAQHDYILENQPGAAFRGDLNAAMKAIVSQNSGATEPATTYPYQFWADTTAGILKQRNAANNGWVNILNLSSGAPVSSVKAGDITSSGLTQNTNRILGRTSASAGAIEEITTGTGLILASGTLSSVFSSAAENAAGTVENKSVDPLGIREAFNATGAAPVFACRAWVNFNGTGTVAIRASGNVSSITDNGTGDYTVNFTNAMPDANYAASLETRLNTLGGNGQASNYATKTASSYRFQGARTGAGGLIDTDENTVAIFR